MLLRDKDDAARGASARAWAPLEALSSAGSTARLWALLTGLVAALVCFGGSMPLLTPSMLDSFDDRVMGMTVAAGIDVSGDIARYYGLLLVFLVAGLLALAIACVSARLAPRREGEAALLRDDHLDAAREYAYVGLFLSGLSLLTGSEAWPACLCYVLCTLHCALGLLAARVRVPSTALLRPLLMGAVPLAAFALVSRTLYGSWRSTGSLLAVALAVLLLATAALAYAFAYGRDRARFERGLSWAVLPLLAAPVLNSLALELKNVLAVRGLLTDPSPYAVYVGLTCLSAALCAGVLLWRSRAGAGEAGEGDRRAVRAGYVLLLLLVLCCAYQPDVTREYGTEYFESANHGLALDALFRYGELPIVENFDAHMLFRQLTGILYYLLNPYEPWAYSLYDTLLCVPVALLFNRLLARFVSDRAALLWSLLVPVFNLTIAARPLVNAMAYSVISFLALFHALRRPGVGSYALYCVSVVATCLLGLDVGVAAIAAGAATFLVVLVRSRGVVRVGRLLFVAAVTIALCGAAWAGLCAACGVDPIERLREFVAVAASNTNWATTPVGEAESLVTALCYFAVPLAVLVLLVRFVVFERLDLASAVHGARGAAWVAVVFFSAFCIANLSRGIVRHNLSEGGAGVLFGTVGIAVFCAVFYFCLGRGVGRTRTFGWFAAASALVCAAYGLAVADGASFLGGFTSDAVKAVDEWTSPESYKETPEVGSRVTGWGSDVDDSTLCQILDATLGEDETYLTLSSTDYLYAITGRKNPLYVNQSPLMLSGDTSQEYALEEIEAAQPVYVLMPRDGWPVIDGIDVDFKYYRLIEYAYENYEPFVQIEGADYDVWCLSDRRAELESALESSGADFAAEWEYLDDYEPNMQGELGLIPLLWAERDEADAWGTCEVSAEAEGPLPRELAANEPVDVVFTDPCGGGAAYLALDVEASEDGILLIGYGGDEAEEPRTLMIAVGAGRHRYLVRVSAYYEWWQGDVTQVSLNPSVDVTLHGCDVRVGD